MTKIMMNYRQNGRKMRKVNNSIQYKEKLEDCQFQLMPWWQLQN